MFGSFIKGFDKFGNSFALNLKGKESKKTLFGGIISIISGLFVMYYGMIKINDVYNRLDPTIKYNSVNFANENF
jgi:hypothetical protein